MLIVMLLVVLIAVILFREEIRFVIGAACVLFLLYGVWAQGPWAQGTLIFGGLGLAVVLFQVFQQKRGAVQSGPAAPAPSAASLPADFNSWYYAVNGKQYGPVTEQQLLAALAARQLLPDTPIRCGINPAWNPAKQLWAGRF